MMKKIIIISGVFAVLLSSAGCKKFLDQEPDNRAKLNSPAKVSQLLASAYPQINYQAMAELSSDNVGDNVTNGIDVPSWNTLISDYYFYRDNTGVDEDGPESYWFGCYKAIAAANLALETIASVPDPQNYQAQKGEALVARAYAHFMLVNFFSKFYDESTASSDKGIPYVTESETVSIKKYQRKTVKYVYDMVEKDLLEGLPLIKDETYSVPKYHFTKSSAAAFASRFYLYKQDYENVIKYAKAALPENSYATNLRPWNTIYTNLPLNGNGSLSAIYSKATENANLLLVETNTWWLNLAAFGKYGLTGELGAYFTGDAPVAGGPWSYRLSYFMEGHNVIPKTDQNFVETSLGSGIGNGWQMVPLFTAEEVLFNLAEAYVYTDQNSKAISLLNTYLTTRIDGYDPALDVIDETKVKDYYGVTDASEGLIYTILDYRQSEFVHEGMRWFDILRYGIEVTHANIDGSDEITLTVDHPHRVFQIPATARAQAGLEANRR
ncbi:RagB/SusD family nutrient uptake outer membrane protein [Ferruginibacter sp. SUN002]|uniref:RagB/SusD family nutrient uptake outer membrane protein n=1 Tax=Ferruginibacter sp. SUN002 TaxID=2937789 RepID=UPI003D367204